MASPIRYEPHETPPPLTTLTLAAQLAALNAAALVITPAIVVRAAGVPEYLPWAVFSAIVVSGLMTIVQARRVWRFGAGHVLVIGVASPYIGVCIAALSEFGAAAMATLTTSSAVVTVLVSRYLAAMRKLLTPVVAGTAVMLVPATVMPVFVEQLRAVPHHDAPQGAALSAATTIFVTAAIALSGTTRMRLWSPITGILAGTAVAAAYGLYDLQSVREAPWIGLPSFAWPGLSMEIAQLWPALGAFFLITAVCHIATIGDATAIQAVSWRTERRPDYRVVQGAINTDGAALVTSGLAGTLPTGSTSASVAMVELTGVAARSVGIVTGILFIAFAFTPKALALIVAVPVPVATAHLAVLMAMLFVVGIKLVTAEPLDHRAGLTVGVAFWLGVGAESGAVYPEFLQTFAGGLFTNGITVGGLAAIAMTIAARWHDPKPKRIETTVSLDALPIINAAIADLAKRRRWSHNMTTAVERVCEEVLMVLMASPQVDSEAHEDPPRRFRVLLASDATGGATAEFLAAPAGRNIEEDLAMLPSTSSSAEPEQQVSLRLLQHAAANVEHQHYPSLDVIKVRIKAG